MCDAKAERGILTVRGDQQEGGRRVGEAREQGEVTKYIDTFYIDM